MGSKWIKKNELTYKNGYFSDAAGNIIMLPKAVHHALEALDYMVQKGQHQKKVRLMKALPEVPEFKQKHITSNIVEVAMPETPNLDKAIQDALTLANEIDEYNDVCDFQKFLDKNPALANFVVGDEFVAELDTPTEILDTPVIGNPLELTIDKLRVHFESAEL